MAENERKTALVSSLARSRAEVTATAHVLRQDLDFAARARHSFARNPAIWIGAATVVGLVFVRFLWPKKRVVVEKRHPAKTEAEIEKAGAAGLALGALKIAFDIARPVLIPWATRLVAERFSPDRNRAYPPR